MLPKAVARMHSASFAGGYATYLYFLYHQLYRHSTVASTSCTATWATVLFTLLVGLIHMGKLPYQPFIVMPVSCCHAITVLLCYGLHPRLRGILVFSVEPSP